MSVLAPACCTKKGGKRNSPDPERSVWGYFSDPTRVRLKSYPLAPAACQASRKGPQRLPFPPCHPHVRGGRAGPKMPGENKERREREREEVPAVGNLDGHSAQQSQSKLSQLCSPQWALGEGKEGNPRVASFCTWGVSPTWIWGFCLKPGAAATKVGGTCLMLAQGGTGMG